MTKQEFREKVQEKILILDGATGSNLLKRGMPYGVCTELWVTEHRDVMIQLQREYIEKGSDIIYAPTFSGNRVKLKEYGLLERMEELNRELVEISKEAAQGNALVAGDITMTGAQLEPMGDMTFDELIDIYKEQIEILVKAGVDLLVVETMMSLQETRAAVIAAGEMCELPVMATLSFKENGKTLYGVSAKSAVAVLQGLGVDAVGINCSAGPDKMLSVIEEMKKYATVPVIAKPNAGMPKLMPDGTTSYDMDAETFAEYMEKLVDAGADLIGGCCGTTPEFIGKIAKPVGKTVRQKEERIPVQTAEGQNPTQQTEEQTIFLASEREVYSFTSGQKLTVGGLIDFSKNQELVEDYQEEIFDTAVDLAFEMEDEEADIIRICVSAEEKDRAAGSSGTSEINEAEAILAVAEELSRNVNLPLMMASTSPETIEYVCRHFSGIMAIQWNHNLEEWKTKIKSIAQSYQVPIVTIDNEIIYC